MEIRVVTETEVESYWALRLRALREEPEAFGFAYEEALEWPIERVIQQLHELNSSPDSFILGAFEDGLVGIVTMRRHQIIKFRHRAEINQMYVASEARGRGIGRALMRELIERARHRPGLEHLDLSVTASNAAARQLYLSLGFETYGVDRQGLKIGDQYFDMELMKLVLKTNGEG